MFNVNSKVRRIEYYDPNPGRPSGIVQRVDGDSVEVYYPAHHIIELIPINELEILSD